MRFNLRDLLWLTVVVGLLLGWYLHYQRLTRPPKLYRDEEIEARHGRYIIDYWVGHLEQEIVPPGTSMPLSQVFKTLGIDPNRLTDFRHAQYNSSISLSWQISPSYDLTCSTLDEDDDALAFDDPKRKIYSAWISDREGWRRGPPPPERSDTTPGVERSFYPSIYTPPWKREPPPPLSGDGPIMPAPPHSNQNTP